MASKNRQVLQKNPTEQRTFDYAKGGVTLRFTLRTDIKSELIDFLELLKEAVEDVTKQIEIKFPK